MAPGVADVLLFMLAWSAVVPFVLLACQRPGERFGDTTMRYRVLVGLWLGLGFFYYGGGPVVFAWAAIALVALIGIGYIAEAVHKFHERRAMASR